MAERASRGYSNWPSSDMSKLAKVEKAYATLGLESSATENEVKTAYKKFALTKHPDKSTSPNANEECKKNIQSISYSKKSIEI